MKSSLKIVNETEYLQLAGIQHFIYCRRQWGLIHLEQQWSENYFTADGKVKHDKVDCGPIDEKIGRKRVLRSLHIVSHQLRIQGKCDVVELIENPEGDYFSKYDANYHVQPVEYKRGKEKEDESDIMQLAAQSICLEEMMGVKITQGYVYYFETRHRLLVPITEEVKMRVKEIVLEMNRYYQQAYVPRVRKTSKCKACSLHDICMPEIGVSRSAIDYIREVIEE